MTKYRVGDRVQIRFDSSLLEQYTYLTKFDRNIYTIEKVLPCEGDIFYSLIGVPFDVGHDVLHLVTYTQF